MSDLTPDLLETGAASTPESTSSEPPAQEPAAASGTGGHVCTDPSHGQHGNGNGYGHNHGGESTSPEGTVDYGGKVNKKDISSNVHFSYGWIAEGNDNAKHTEGAYGGEAPSSPLGVPIYVWLEPGEDKKGEEMAYNDGYFASLSFVLTSDTLGNTGTFYAGNGQELTEGTVIEDSFGNTYSVSAASEGKLTITIRPGADSAWMPVDLSGMGGLYFRPDDAYSDADFQLRYEAHLTNEKSAAKYSASAGDIIVDAVADKPLYLGGGETEAFIGASSDGELMPAAIEFKDGRTMHTLGGSVGTLGETTDLKLGNIRFPDHADGSEEHFILIRASSDCNWSIAAAALGSGDYAAFVRPEGGTVETVWLDAANALAAPGAAGAQEYYKLRLDADFLNAHAGLVDLRLPVMLGTGTQNGTYDFDVKAAALETVVAGDASNGEKDFGNNFAVTDMQPTHIKVQVLASTVTISTGWAYESAAAAGTPGNRDADPDATGFGAGETTKAYISQAGDVPGSAAVITIRPSLAPGESISEYVTLAFDAGRGDLYDRDGQRISSSAGGESFATVPSRWLIDQDYPIYFIPSQASDDHSDIPISYEFTIYVPGTDGETRQYTAKGEIPLVIDAVADPAEAQLDASGEAPQFDGFILEYAAQFRDDPTETQYIVIKDPSGLLHLEDLGPWGAFLETVSLSELQSFENPDPGAKRHLDMVSAGDIILRVKDLHGFDGADSVADGKIDFQIPFTVSNRDLAGDSLDVTVQTIVIEQGGNNAANWSGPDGEYDFANNISVTEDTAKVYLAQGAVQAGLAGAVYEGDRPLQHLVGEAEAPHYGTPVSVCPADPYEALHSLSFAARTADGSPLDGAMYFGFGGSCTRIPEGGRLVFASRVEGAQALYTGVSILDADGTVLAQYAIVPAMSLEAVNASGPNAGLRFIPQGDNDADVIIDMAGLVTDVRSGDVVTHEQLATVTVTRDAVADKPQNVVAAIVQPDGSSATVVAGSTVTVDISASFGDYSDASETQYLFISRDYVEAVSLGEQPGASFTLLDAEAAATVCGKVKGERGLADADPDSYFVIEVSRDYLRQTEGHAALSIQAKLRTDDAIPKDGSDTIAVIAVAMEYDGLKTGHDISAINAEVTAENNVAVSPAKAHIAWATLEKDFSFAVSGPVYENDQPAQHVGDLQGAGGCTISIASADPSEVIDTLTIQYAGADGTPAAGRIFLAAGGAVLEIPAGTTLRLEYDQDHREQCVSVSHTDADGHIQTLRVPNLTLAQLTSQGLRYVPDAEGNESDTDIVVSFTGMARETETGESGTFSAGPLHITADAVADKPGGARTDYDYTQYGTDSFGNQHEAIAEGDPVSFRIDTAFRDYADGSETHYLLINTRYLVPGSLEVLDAVTGAPFDGATVISDPPALAAFFAQVKGEPGIERAPGDAYVLLEVDEAYLARNAGAVSLTVNGSLLGVEQLLQYGPQKTPLAFEVKAVAVEHQGYATASLPDGDLEYSSQNNVAVTDLDVSFTWDVLSGEFTLAAGVAHEDDQPGQAAGDATAAGGAPLVITPQDPTEVITSLHLGYDDAHGDVTLTVAGATLALPPGAELTFTFDEAAPTHITAVICGGETLAVPGLTLAELTASGLRYVPRAGDNTDTDVTVTITAETLETTIGTTGSVELTQTVIVDAVADMPQESSGAVTITQGKGSTAILNEATGQDSFAITLHARFDDYADASEAHYIFISSQYLSAVDGLPDGLSHFDGDAEQLLSDAGLGSGHIVLVVDGRHLEAHGGVFDGTLTAHLNGAALPPEDEELSISIKTGAVEYAGLNTGLQTSIDAAGGVEAAADNNVALADASVILHYSRLDRVFTVHEVAVSEGDAPNQHMGNLAPAGGAVIGLAPKDESEVFDTLAVSYADGEGALYLDLPVLGMGNQRILLADGAELGFSFRNQNAGATQCTAVTVTTAEGTAVYTLASALSFSELMGAHLRYIPRASSQSDADVPITFTGVARETSTNEQGGFTHTVRVKVDAVADMPEAASVVANAAAGAGHNALDPASLFDIRVSADFGGDLADGSEGHYLFINDTWLAAVHLPEESEGLVQLSAAEAKALCQNAGLTGKAGTFFVFRVDNGWLLEHGGRVDMLLLGQLKDPAALKLAEGKTYTIAIKAASVEHQGLKTPLNADLGDGHGLETAAANNAALEDASVTFTYAVADGKLKAIPNQVYEGSQPGQHTGVMAAAEGGAVTLAPADESEVFTELVLSYDPAHGELSLSDLNGTTVNLASGATLRFTYDSEGRPTECLGIEVLQEGQEPVLLSYTDAAGRGRDLTSLTGQYLRYTPALNDDDDADVALRVTGTVLETESGATAALDTTVGITVDAVADMPTALAGRALVCDDTGEHIAALPGDDFTTVLTVRFTDYEDGSEAHYLLLTREHLHDIHNLQGASLCGATEAAAVFNALYIKGAGGIHAGSAAAAKKYYVLKVDDAALLDTGGQASISFESTAQEVGVHTVTAVAVSVEHAGYRTNTGNAGEAHGREITAENNIAETASTFTMTVRQFEPDKVVVSSEKWAFENDRSAGDESYRQPGDAAGRDGGVPLHITPPADGNVISSVTLHYAMPANGSPTPHQVVTDADPASVTITQTIAENVVTVTIEANDTYGSIGNLSFIPGDNYDNADASITISQIHVADPLLHTTTRDDPDWGSGVAEGHETLTVRVDAVAQAPDLGGFTVDHNSEDPVLAGGVLHISGEVSFEDTADGSEDHFLLLEIQDGYYPDAVTLMFEGRTVTLPVTHYSSEGPANYSLQQLVTADDGHPHMFMKLPVDASLAELMGGARLERMDGIRLDVAYQTREWAAEGTALHFAAISTEDVEAVRQYDADWNIINDELPFDKQLEKHVPGLVVMENNTAIAVAAQGAYVYWDALDSDEVNFRGYVFENDRPADHQRVPAYILHRPASDKVQAYPVHPALMPEDAAGGRDFGTGWQLTVPEHVYSFTLTESAANQGRGDFYYLPASVWAGHMASGADSDQGLSAYRVVMGEATEGRQGFVLVFIPANDAYTGAHQENDAPGAASHADTDYRFSYEFVTSQYSPGGTLVGYKRYLGEDKVIRIDAVANQAELISAETNVPSRHFSLWNVQDSVSSFELTVDFHDMDATEDHYVLVEMVPNFAFRCGSYYYRPHGGGNVAETESNAIYTHIFTDANGNQQFIRYYKIPVSNAAIDPATGEVTVRVEFQRLPGMPLTADYPSSDMLTYGAMTVDKTASRWDSTDPTSPSFVNRKGADGEYSYDNNTSVIIRNGIGDGAEDTGLNPGWTPPGKGGALPDIVIEDPHGTGEPIIITPDDPRYNPNVVIPGPNHAAAEIIKPWLVVPGWAPTHDPDSPHDPWRLPDPDEAYIPWTPPEGGGTPASWLAPDDPEHSDPWIASRGQGLAVQWVFENSTPYGNTEAGQYPAGYWPAAIYFTNNRPNDAACVKITVPGIDSQMLEAGILNPREIPWVLGENSTVHPVARLDLIGANTITGPIKIPGTNDVVYTIATPNGQLPANAALMLSIAPDSKGEDFQLGVEWYDANGHLLSSGPVDVYVDAVAQWANFVLDNAGGVYGVTGEAPCELVSVDVHVGFLDQDGSEANYVLVEKVPGVLVLHRGADGSFDTVREVYLEGRTYYQIEATAEEQRNNLVRLEFSVNEELLSPMYVRNDIVHDGMTFSGLQIDIGTMTVEGQTGWAESGAQPANWEYTLKNNTSLNLQDDALTIVVSRVNAKGGNSTVYTEETDAPEEHLVRIDPHDPRNGLNLAMDGNDVLDSLIITGISGNGAFWYEDEAGERHLVTVGMDVTEAYLAGRLFHEQERYRDDDAHLEWSASLHDGLSAASDVTVEGRLTVAVDAVASASEISLGYPVIDGENHTLTQQLTFADHEGNEQHYAVIAPDLYRVIGRQASVRDGNGEWHTVEVETIFSPEGTPYYGVLLDGFLDAEGTVTVQFDMRELSIPGIENYPVVSGGVSIEPNSGFFPDDREPVLTNNWAINTEVRFVHEGTVSTRGLGLTADFVVEDDAAGAPLLLSGEMGANDVLVSSVVTFAAAEGASLGATGRQVATIVYGGACFAVMADGAGNAVAEIPFGAQGFDPAADFRIIWGTAHVEEGTVVVDTFNHAANGRLDLSAAFTVRNQLSNTETIFTAADGNGIDLIPRADAAREVQASTTAVNGQPAHAEPWVGAGADSFTVTLGAAFDDLDGSETHYLMLELPQACEVVSPADGDIHVYEGVRYYRVEVPASEAAPAVSLTLRAADGTNQALELKTAAMSVESSGQHTRYTGGPAVSLRISDVSATGIDAAEAHTVEDVPLSLDFLATSVLLNDDGNDELRSITFTDLKGGVLTDADGNALPGMTVTAAELAAGAVFYRPAANHAGELDALGRPLPVELAYEAQLGETNTGAAATLTGQTLTLFITPAADAPGSVEASTDATELDDVQAGHKALLTVELTASYPDADGSEEHFFILHTPQGVAVAEGEGYTVSTLSPAELAALTARFPDFAGAGPLYRLAVDGTQENIAVSVHLEVTTTVYNGGLVRVMGAAAEQLADGAYDYGFSSAPDVPLPPPVAPGLGNAAPDAQPSLATLDSLRQSAASGSLLMEGIDPDGDDVTVSAVAGATLGTDAEGRPVYVAEGAYGTLHVYENGAYSYELREDARGAAGREVFGYTVSDGYGGAGESSITIELTTPNTAPSAQDVAAELNSVRASTVSGTLALADSEGDAVIVAAVNGSSGMIDLGTEAEPRMGFEAAGEFGTLRVYEEGGAWRYEYTLDPAHRGETRGESFSFTVKDAFGLQSVEDAVIEIGLFNDNADPVAENVHTAMDSLRDADRTAAGTAALSDAEGDPVLLIGASGAGGEGDWGQDEGGARAFVVAGAHGTLYLYEGEGTELRYRYVLTDSAAGGVSATESFTYRVRDDFSGKDEGTITIDLTNTNNAPEISGDLTGELDTLRSTGELAGSLTVDDPDYNADQGRHDAVRLSMVSFNGVAGAPDGAGGFTVRGAHGVFHIDAAGSYTYTLDADAAGPEDETEEFQITVTDEFGLESTAPVRIALVVHNQDPVVTDGHIRLDTLRDGGSASGSVTFTDADGDTVKVCALAGVTTGALGTDPQGHEAYVARGAHGTLYLRPDGAYTYVLDEDASGAGGSETFSFGVDDGHKGGGTGIITIELDNANSAPVITGNLSAVVEGCVQEYENGIVFKSGQLTWADAEGDGIGPVTVGGVVLSAGETAIEGAYGTLVVSLAEGRSGASWTYTLKPGMDGRGIDDVESFAVVVPDMYGEFAPASLDITLKPLTHAPECDDVLKNWGKTESGRPVSFIDGQLAFSDADTAYDPTESLHLTVNGEAVTESRQIQGKYGVLTIGPDGNFKYNYTLGTENFDVLEDFVYTVTDSKGYSDTAHLYIRLSDDAPAFPGAEQTPEAPQGPQDAPADMTGRDTAPQEDAPDPAEIGLASVPLPYDPADMGMPTGF